MNFLKIALIYLFATPLALASPGAHGPNGEHLEAEAGHVHSSAGPRIEAFTESFELVGQLQDEELSILIDHYETNEPVLNAKLEVELDGIKAAATFHADHGDYAISDAAMLQALAKPGSHALVFTLTTARESDLLEGTLEVSPTDAASHQEHGAGVSWKLTALGLIVLAILLIATLVVVRRRRFSGSK